jgi:hypothetical protein
MLGGFLFHLRSFGLKVSINEWLALVEALGRGYARADLGVFYHLARALLVKRETELDRYDEAFATYFRGAERRFAVDEELLRWLEHPVLPRELTAAERCQLEAWDLAQIRQELAARLQEQRRRHDGGPRWVGTGGTSPFGQRGTRPGGVRLGDHGGNHSAVAVATERRFQNLRGDRVLDTRQLSAALRRLRTLARSDAPEELDLDATIDQSAKNGGEIDLVMARPRTNQVKLLLLMDVGGSMEPHAILCERLFAAARAARGFKTLKIYFFHNCVYDRLYVDMAHGRGPATTEVLQQLDPTWSMVLVGDAWMAPYELTVAGAARLERNDDAAPGIEWLRQLRQRVPCSVWLNPEPAGTWAAYTIRLVRAIFPMCELTLDGLDRAVEMLRRRRAEPQPLSPAV